jgi:predicted dehydrogenase
VVVDKAMACTVKECTAMIETARKCNRMLAVFHNRQHDGNFRRVQQLVADGSIGDVFDIVCSAGWYGCPAKNWYADQKSSGGMMFIWAPHALDWIFRLVPGKVVGVDSYGQKRLWQEVDVLDHQRLIMRFESGVTAELFFSYLNMAPLPLWRILGTQGAILDSGENALHGYYPQYQDNLPPKGTLRLLRPENAAGEDIPYLPSTWGRYYQEVAAHLLDGAPAPVSGELGRRTIAILEAAARSCASGHTEVPEYP